MHKMKDNSFLLFLFLVLAVAFLFGSLSGKVVREQGVSGDVTCIGPGSYNIELNSPNEGELLHFCDDQGLSCYTLDDRGSPDKQIC